MSTKKQSHGRGGYQKRTNRRRTKRRKSRRRKSSKKKSRGGSVPCPASIQHPFSSSDERRCPPHCLVCRGIGRISDQREADRAPNPYRKLLDELRVLEHESMWGGVEGPISEQGCHRQCLGHGMDELLPIILRILRDPVGADFSSITDRNDLRAKRRQIESHRDEKNRRKGEMTSVLARDARPPGRRKSRRRPMPGNLLLRETTGCPPKKRPPTLFGT